MKWKISIEGNYESPVDVTGGVGRVTLGIKDLLENFISILRRGGHCVTSMSCIDDLDGKQNFIKTRSASAILSPSLLSTLIGLPKSMTIKDVKMVNTSANGPTVMVKISHAEEIVPDNASLMLSYTKDSNGNYKLSGMRETSY